MRWSAFGAHVVDRRRTVERIEWAKKKKIQIIIIQMKIVGQKRVRLLNGDGGGGEKGEPDRRILLAGGSPLRGRAHRDSRVAGRGGHGQKGGRGLRAAGLRAFNNLLVSSYTPAVFFLFGLFICRLSTTM